jgi:hypothetical protein
VPQVLPVTPIDTLINDDVYSFAARTIRTTATPISGPSFTAISDAMLTLAFDTAEEFMEWDNKITSDEIAIGTVAIVSSAISAGYVIWLLRGGTLIAGLLSSIPAWCSFDPLPIVETYEAAERKAHDNEGLTSIVLKAVENRRP